MNRFFGPRQGDGWRPFANGFHGLPMLVVAMALVLSSGCSVRRMAINKMGDALSGSGTTFASDDDPELVKQAVPFSLKLIESLLAETPRHQGLLLAATKGFTLYSYAFVQTEADLVEDKDLQAATELRDRARRLYLRARGYGLRGLEARHPGIEQRLRKEPRNAVRDLHLEDLPWVYWTSISWAAAISLSKDNPDLIADLPTVEALVDRAENLCPDYDSGGLQSFLINFESVRQHRQGDLKARIHAHYQRAMEISKGALASPLVSYAEAISVQNQNLAEFETLLNQALALDVDAHPIFRLENLITQRRAKWLLGRKDQLFLITEKPVETQ